MNRSKKPERKVKISVSVDLHDVRQGDSEPELAAYAFTPGGRLLQQAPLKSGSATLEVRATGEERGAVRVVVGPRELRDEGELADLFRLNAAERTIPLEVGATKVETSFAIPRPAWLCWLRGLCVVRGKLLRRVESGGIPIDMPVCGAEVEIYEVDPLPHLFPRIPDDILDRLRELVRIPWPFPPEPPNPPDPGPLLAEAEKLIASLGATPKPAAAPGVAENAFVSRSDLAQLAEERFAQLQPESELMKAGGEKARPEGVPRTVRLASPPPELPRAEEVAQSIRALSESEPISLAASQSLSAFRNALIANADLVRPLLCRFLPFVTRQLVATTTTDECGRFNAWFSQGCSSDTPDLYFVAYRRFGSCRILIYEPLPVACHVHWNYDCGSEVTLHSTSPLAPTCPPCRPVVAKPGWVNVAAIGNTPLSRIHGTGAELSSEPADIGLTEDGAPFGGVLRPRLEFDNSLREELGIRYCRISWKKAGSGNPWVPLELAVHRHYSHEEEPSPGHLKLVFEVYPLGPHVVGGEAGLFEIPPPLPPIGQWTEPDLIEDTANGRFPTGGCWPGTYGLVPPGSEGIYKLRIELFHDDGTPVDLAAEGVHFVVPKSKDLSGTVETEEAAALGLVPGPPVDSGNAFVMRLNIDNNPTTALIAPPLLNGSTEPDPNCGTIQYSPKGTDNVTIAYTASHPHGFARYHFILKRGVTELPASQHNKPVGSGSYSSNEPVSSLLGGCAVAGFAEELHVAGTAIDGWYRLEYDAHDLRAFVLKPPGE
jgi:hypothetical protein